MPKHLFPSEAVGSKPLVRFLPMMVVRLMLSLKKATAQEDAWNFGEPTIRFSEPRRAVAMGHDRVCLGTFASGSVGTKSQV